MEPSPHFDSGSTAPTSSLLPTSSTAADVAAITRQLLTTQLAGNGTITVPPPPYAVSGGVPEEILKEFLTPPTLLYVNNRLFDEPLLEDIYELC